MSTDVDPFAVSKAAEIVRRELVKLRADEDRRDALILAGICDGCGRDLRNKFGYVDVCHCRNDE